MIYFHDDIMPDSYVTVPANFRNSFRIEAFHTGKFCSFLSAPLNIMWDFNYCTLVCLFHGWKCRLNQYFNRKLSTKSAHLICLSPAQGLHPLVSQADTPAMRWISASSTDHNPPIRMPAGNQFVALTIAFA